MKLPFKPSTPLLVSLCVVAFVTVAVLVSLHPSSEADIFFHLELGRSVLTHGTRIVPEPFAFHDFEPTCMVPAWLWDVLAYGVHALGGFAALTLLNLVSALAATLLLARCAWLWRGNAGVLGWATVSTASLICVSTRIALRPQTLALALVAGYLLLLHDYTRKSTRVQRNIGIALVGIALIWAQLHGSFVLAPALFVIILAGARLQATGEHERISATQLAVLFVLLLTLFSSAAGLDVVGYIAGHGYGDAVQFIAEMKPPTWSELVSLNGASGKALVLLWLLSLFGLTQGARFQWVSIALAITGHMLLSRAHRFVAEDAILCMPLALSGASNIAAWAQNALPTMLRRAALPLGFLALATLLVLDVKDSLRGYGGRFGMGLEEPAFPVLATAYLERMPKGTRVLSAFSAGPAIGFWSRGRLRTYVDGRAPLYFDDTDYAVERDVLTNAESLERAIRRYGVRAAVVERAHGVCDLLSKHWHAVVIEGAYSTFVPPDVDAPLRGVDPCGPEFVHRPKQASDVTDLDDSIARLAALHASPFIDMLRAERMLLQPGPAIAQLHMLVDASASSVYASAHRRLRIAALASVNDIDGAYALMHEALLDGDVTVLGSMTLPQLGTLDLGRARTLLELGVGLLGEGTPPATRSMLAAMCVQQNDALCARYNAMRAATRAAPNVEPSLEWLTQHAATPRMRADAKAWLQLLRDERAAQPR